MASVRPNEFSLATAGYLPRVSVVLPCLDEAMGVATATREALEGLVRHGLPGEIIVVDNGSRDGSARIAAEAGATVVQEPRRGYGAACRRGLVTATGEIVVLADADGSYDLRELGSLTQRVVLGADLVIGSRIHGTIDAEAMPWLHRRVGTPLLNALVVHLTGRRFGDTQSGFRAMRRDRALALALTAEGMELATEMIVRAHRAGLRIEEAPIGYRRRVGTSKLRPVRDGLRHLSLLLTLRDQGARPGSMRKTMVRSSS